MDSNAAAAPSLTRFDISISVHTIEINKKDRTMCLVGFLTANENLEARQTMEPMSEQKFNETLEILSTRAMQGELEGLHLLLSENEVEFLTFRRWNTWATNLK